MVEIITKPSAHPSRKWHDIAKTNMAKKHIRAALAVIEASAKGGSVSGRKKN
jgi:(p)ppGpp synthase/HD superfamily hydrolase